MGWDRLGRLQGATSAVVVFGAYVEKVLAPSLRPRQVVLMDNLLKLTGPRGSGS
jgi:hypothetical protein